MHVDFTPPLPFNKEHLLRHMPVGHLIKFVITYATPFWREDGLSGEVVSYDNFDVSNDGKPKLDMNKNKGICMILFLSILFLSNSTSIFKNISKTKQGNQKLQKMLLCYSKCSFKEDKLNFVRSYLIRRQRPVICRRFCLASMPPWIKLEKYKNEAREPKTAKDVTLSF